MASEIHKNEIWGVLYKKVFLKISQNSQENPCARVSFFNKVAGLRPKTLPQVFSWEFCEISKNKFFTEHLWTTVLSDCSRHRQMYKRTHYWKGNHTIFSFIYAFSCKFLPWANCKVCKYLKFLLWGDYSVDQKIFPRDCRCHHMEFYSLHCLLMSLSKEEREKKHLNID